MNIVAKYAESSVDIEGSAESLRELSQVIQKTGSSGTLVFRIPQNPPTPYLAYAKSLRICPSQGNISIIRNGDEIIINGSPEKLFILAQNIEGLAEQATHESPGNHQAHLHIEYHPGHFYLQENSIPLIVTRNA
jgi:hypothetical protein